MSRLNDENLTDEFVAESLDHLDAIEPDLLALEESGDDVSPEIINRVFRAIHTIKGSAGFLGFNAIMKLSHAMENLLVKIREGEVSPDPDKIDVLLTGMDKLRAMLDAPQQSEEGNIKDEMERLKAILPDEIVPSKEQTEEPTRATKKGTIYFSGQKDGKTRIRIEGPPSLGKAEFEVDREDLTSIGGMHVYAVWLFLNRDLEANGRTLEEFTSLLESLGSCVGSDLEDIATADVEEDLAQGRLVRFLFATVMEPDLMGEALDIPEEQVMALDKGDLDAAMAEEEQTSCGMESATEQVKPASDSKVLKNDRGTSHDTIRVNVELLDTLMNLAGELVLGRNQLRQMLEDSVYENPKLDTVMQNVDHVTSEVQEHIMQMRMQPIYSILTKFQRIARDLSRQLSKEVELVTEGGEVELDKSILEGLSDPLTHLIRNCVDHGIEPPEERIRLGKPRAGRIHLRAFHGEGQVNITITDNGRGIDTDKVVEEAVANGFLKGDEAKKMNQKEKLNVILLPGISTAKATTDLSGRGVGMDVVRTNIEKLGGHLDIDSKLGSGTTIHIRLPLTLAIIPCLIVIAGKCRFAIPQINISELVCIQAGDVSRMIEKVGSADVLRLRERLLPLVRLADLLGLERKFIHPGPGDEMTDRRVRIVDRREEQERFYGEPAQLTGETRVRRKDAGDRRRRRQGDIYVVVLRLGVNSFGLMVDQLFDIEEIVVKPLLGHIKECNCFAGATIMGDGRVAMILDASGIVDSAQLRFSEIELEERRRQKEIARHQESAASDRKTVIIFNNAPEEHFALLLSDVSRLEMIDPQMIELIGKQEFITYRNEGLPLIRLEKVLPVSPVPENTKELYIIIPKTNGSKAGIVASRILDVLDTDVAIQKDASTVSGLLGSGVVQGKLTLFLNVRELVELSRNEV